MIINGVKGKIKDKVKLIGGEKFVVKHIGEVVLRQDGTVFLPIFVTFKNKKIRKHMEWVYIDDVILELPKWVKKCRGIK